MTTEETCAAIVGAVGVVFEAMRQIVADVQSWLIVADAFQRVADSIEIGYVCPHCGARRGRFEYCQECGAQ